ncbi:MAG: [protein-PII] uridylyltransferase [Acidimicrobiales bacterium]
MNSSRTPLLVAPKLRGREYAEAHAEETDRWFRQVATEALDDLDGIALLAVGGYGRGQLSPFSDVDVVLVHDESVDGSHVAEALWYPVWDRGLKMGYVVVTPAQAKVLLADEFEWATAFLDTRLIAGDRDLMNQIDVLTAEAWRDRREPLLEKLVNTVEARHKARGDVAFQIEPNLKEGRGGLRDVHALGWATRALPGFADDFLHELTDDIDTLLEARVELHRLNGRPGDIMTLDDQDGVAAALGDEGAQQLMLRLALAARRIAWYSDEAWSRWNRAKRHDGESRGDAADPETSASQTAGQAPLELVSAAVGDTSRFSVGRGLIAIRPDAGISSDPLLLLKLAVLAAETGLVMSRQSLTDLAWQGTEIERPWPEEARNLFSALFLTGRAAIPVVEDLDQFGLMERLIPEWTAVLCKPQRNVLHTFTVDRHLCEAAANASALVDRVTRPDLLVVGALLHDIGKGYPGDHTEVGMELIAEIAERMGYPPSDVAVLVDLCRHHLLLPDVATRRDLSDPGTIKAVAAAVDSVPFLDLLAALTEADSIATGPSAWGQWKAGLLRELVHRTTNLLEGADVDDVVSEVFPTPEVAQLMEAGERVLKGEGVVMTVVAPERLGLFTTMAGVLAVCGLEVLDASAFSEDVEANGTANSTANPTAGSMANSEERPPMASCQFVVQLPQTGSVDWDHVIDVAERALDGRLALQARVSRKAREQARYQRRLAAEPPRKEILIDNDISDVATVVEVHGPDDIGLLYRLTQVVRELQLDLRSAKVQTLGPLAVDSFYLRDANGNQVTDPDLVAELRLALQETIS